MAPHLEIGKPASYHERIKVQIASYGLAIESIAGTGGIGMDTPEFDAVIEAAQQVGTPIVEQSIAYLKPLFVT